jgi:acyl carrier protein
MGFLFLIDFLKQEFQIEVQNCDLVDDNFSSINTISAFVIKELEQIE